jgi:hypothetical protein
MRAVDRAAEQGAVATREEADHRVLGVRPVLAGGREREPPGGFVQLVEVHAPAIRALDEISEPAEADVVDVVRGDTIRRSRGRSVANVIRIADSRCGA